MSAAPNNVDLKARLARLTPAQRAALAERLGNGEHRRQSASVPLVPCPARATAGEGVLVVPASHAQRRMWFLHSYAPDSPAYNTAKLFRLHGPLDGAVLERAFQALAARHETLRTTFELRGSEVMQVVARHAEFRLETTDLSGLAEAEREAQMARLAKEWSRRAFDLERGPLWRAWLVRLGAEEHALVVVVHHIVFDGWSVGVFCRELGSIYDSLVAGRPTELPELRAQYADFAHWQERFLRGQVLSRLTGYWQRKLQDAPPALDLPADRPRPPVESLRGANRNFTVPRALRAELAALAQREEVTLFMVLLAAFKVLLFRHSGQEDVTVGVPFANRNPRETEALIGCFLNTLPLRTGLTGNPAFSELLQRVKQTVLEAHDHADLPFESLVQLLPTGRDLSRSPWFQYFFQLRNVPRELIEAGPVRCEMVALPTGTAKFTLSLHVDEQDGELACDWEYDTALFDAETIDRLAARWETLLRGLVATPGTRVAELPLLPAGEQRLLAEWNRTERAYRLDVPLHRWIEEQIEQTPAAVALRFQGQEVSYGELGRRADRLASFLRSHGAGPNRLVAVYLERSVEMVVALLGVLKAGAAYVPVDPEYPAERVAFMIEDAGAECVLTLDRLRSRLPAGRARVVSLDTGWEEIEAAPAVGGAASGPDDLAYVIYTSGTTGRPKGVRNTHRGIVNRLLWMQEEFRLTAADKVLQKTPFSFDVSVWEFFWPLMAGAQLVVARPGGHREPDYLCDLIQREAITVLHFVPSMLAVFLDAPGAGGCLTLRDVIASGEALPHSLQQRFFGRLPARLHNLYGPTEAAVDVTCWHCRRDSPLDLVPIGWPIANTRCHILDARLQAVPPGATGELYLGGVQVGAGYHNRPELTAERFVQDVFVSAPQARLYRTGDLARYRADGAIEFLGRTDFQVKIRGLRIELGEVEAALEQLPKVREAAVLAREDAPGDVRLVAYVVAEAVDTPNAKSLRDALAQRLPDYMVPTAFVFLPALPLTPNGKLDRSALPRPEAGGGAAASETVLPQSLLEYRLAGLWERTLGVRGVHPGDDFFALGGHSLLGVRLMMDIGELVGQPVPIATLFHAPTPHGMARLLTARHLQPAWSSLVPLQPHGTLPPLFCIHGWGGGVWDARALGGHLGTDQPIYGLQAVGIEDQNWQHTTVEEMATHYAAEIRSFQPHGPYYLCGYSLGGVIAYDVARQLVAQGQPVGLLAVLDTYPKNLPVWPQVKAYAPYLLARLGHHLQQLRFIPAAEAAGYVRGRLQALNRHAGRILARRRQPPALAERAGDAAPVVTDYFVEVSNRYRPIPSTIPVALFRAEGGQIRNEVGWRHLAEGGLEIIPLRCGHLEMLSEPHLGRLATELRRVLAKARAPQTL